eukprot:6001899-Prymnesium_polylepis.1
MCKPKEEQDEATTMSKARMGWATPGANRRRRAIDVPRRAPVAPVRGARCAKRCRDPPHEPRENSGLAAHLCLLALERPVRVRIFLLRAITLRRWLGWGSLCALYHLSAVVFHHEPGLARAARGCIIHCAKS